MNPSPPPQPGQPPGTNPYAAPQFSAVPPPPPDGGQYAPCPRCGGTSATKVGFSWWGGVLGPRLLNHVKCAGCRTKYNGKTGHYNTLGITVYCVVGTVLGIAVFIVLAMLR